MLFIYLTISKIFCTVCTILKVLFWYLTKLIRYLTMSKCEIYLQLQHLTSFTSVPSASLGRFSGIFRKEAKLSPGSFSASVNLFAACHQPTLDYIHLNSQRVMRIMLAGVLTLDVCLWLPRTTNGQLPVRLSPSLIQTPCQLWQCSDCHHPHASGWSPKLSLRKDTFRMLTPTFGHCPNSDWTPQPPRTQPNTLGHFLSDQFDKT